MDTYVDRFREGREGLGAARHGTGRTGEEGGLVHCWNIEWRT